MSNPDFPPNYGRKKQRLHYIHCPYCHVFTHRFKRMDGILDLSLWKGARKFVLISKMVEGYCLVHIVQT